MTRGKELGWLDRPLQEVLTLHVWGLLLVGTWSCWFLLTGWAAGTPGWRAVSVLTLAAGGYILARWIALHFGRWIVPLSLVGVSLLIIVLSPTPNFSYFSGQGFLGYSNARAAFFVQAGFAAILLLATVRSWKLGIFLVPVIALFLAVPPVSRSYTACLSSVLVLPALFVVVFRRGHKVLWRVAIGILLATVLLSFWMARASSGKTLSHRESESLTGLHGRVNLWGEAFQILSKNPLAGVGPGGFQRVSRAAQQEHDHRWVHNEYLQIAVETGIPGLLLFLALTGWIFLVLGRPQTDSSIVSTYAFTAFAMHACTDYVLHFPLLPIVVAALVGSGAPRGRKWVMGRTVRRKVTRRR